MIEGLPEYPKQVKYYHHIDSYNYDSHYYFGGKTPGWIRTAIYDLYIRTCYAKTARVEWLLKDCKPAFEKKYDKMREKELIALERLDKYLISPSSYAAAPADKKFKIYIPDIY